MIALKAFFARYTYESLFGITVRNPCKISHVNAPIEVQKILAWGTFSEVQTNVWERGKLEAFGDKALVWIVG